MNKKIIIFMLYLCWTLPVFGIGLTGGSILDISQTAKDKSLAGAITAEQAEIASFAYNPAGLSDLTRRCFSFNYLRWISDINFTTLAYAQPLKHGVFTGNINYWGMDDFVQFNSSGVQLNNPLSYSGLGISIGYGLFLYHSLQGGIKIKYYYEKLIDYSSHTLSGDFGFQYGFKVPNFNPGHEWIKKKNLKLGFQLQNLGLFLKNFNQKEEFPIALKIGSNYDIYSRLNNIIFISFDIHHFFQEWTFLCFGVEWNYHEFLNIRGGYRCSLQNTNIAKYSLGGGVQFSMLSLLNKIDYTIAPSGDLGYTHFITLTIYLKSK